MIALAGWFGSARGWGLVVSFASANRDAAVFADPDRFDPRRTPNPAPGLWSRPALLPGRPPGPVQVRALFAELLGATAAIEYAGHPAYLRSNFQRGVKRLPIRWVAAGSARAPGSSAA